MRSSDVLMRHEDIRTTLGYGGKSKAETVRGANARVVEMLRRGVSSAVLNLTDRQLAALIERGRGWPWNGYELRADERGREVPAAAVDGAQAPVTRLAQSFFSTARLPMEAL